MAGVTAQNAGIKRASRKTKTAALHFIQTITKKRPAAKDKGLEPVVKVAKLTKKQIAAEVSERSPRRSLRDQEKKTCRPTNFVKRPATGARIRKQLHSIVRRENRPTSVNCERSSAAKSPLKSKNVKQQNQSHVKTRRTKASRSPTRSPARTRRTKPSKSPARSPTELKSAQSPKRILKIIIPRCQTPKVKSPQTPPRRAKKLRSPKTKKPKVTTTVKVEEVDNTVKYVGAHVSISGGIHNAVDNAVELGAKSFALFVKSNHQWIAKPITKKDAALFKKKCNEKGFLPQLIVPHGSYLMNCGAPNNEVLHKSRLNLLEEVQRCETLGLTLFNFHPGSSCGKITQEESIDRIIKSINYALNGTSNVTILIENMCGQGYTIGGKFEELKTIIDGIQDKDRIGVCLDTCHAFAAGYNLANKDGYEAMMQEFESIIGLKYLKAMHLNDSLGDVGCHLDRHANIGCGKIGTEGFKMIMNDKRLNGIPMVLETPPVVGYKEEIKILNDLNNT